MELELRACRIAVTGVCLRFLKKVFVKKLGLANIWGNTHNLPMLTVGAVIDRPRRTGWKFRKTLGKYAAVLRVRRWQGIILHDTARAINDRPYNINGSQVDEGNSIQTSWIFCLAKRFYDHVIRNGNDYQDIWNYIEGNPSKWAED